MRKIAWDACVKSHAFLRTRSERSYWKTCVSFIFFDACVNRMRLFATKKSQRILSECTLMQLNWVELRQTTPLEAATINHLHAPVTIFTFGYSASQIYELKVRNADSDQLWDNDQASWSSVLYLGLEPTHHGLKSHCKTTGHLSYMQMMR